MACAACLSVGFIILHFGRWPYKLAADNVFKAMVEVQIFLIILVALVLKIDLEALGEVVGEGAYDAAVITLFVLNVPVGFVCTVAVKMRDASRQRAQKDASGMAELRQALALHCSGLADAEDTQVRPGLRRAGTLWHRIRLHFARSFSIGA